MSNNKPPVFKRGPVEICCKQTKIKFTFTKTCVAPEGLNKHAECISFQIKYLQLCKAVLNPASFTFMFTSSLLFPALAGTSQLLHHHRHHLGVLPLLMSGIV